MRIIIASATSLLKSSAGAAIFLADQFNRLIGVGRNVSQSPQINRPNLIRNDINLIQRTRYTRISVQCSAAIAFIYFGLILSAMSLVGGLHCTDFRLKRKYCCVFDVQTSCALCTATANVVSRKTRFASRPNHFTVSIRSMALQATAIRTLSIAPCVQRTSVCVDIELQFYQPNTKYVPEKPATVASTEQELR